MDLSLWSMEGDLGRWWCGKSCACCGSCCWCLWVLARFEMMKMVPMTSWRRRKKTVGVNQLYRLPKNVGVDETDSSSMVFGLLQVFLG